MKQRCFINKFVLAVGMISLFHACKTQDVYPTVRLVASAQNLRDDGGELKIIARLNGPVASPMRIPLIFDGSALLGTHYRLSSDEIIVEPNVDSGFIVVTSIPRNDTLMRQIEVRFAELSNALLRGAEFITISIVSATADRDGDGIPDVNDACPEEPGPIENNGCPWKGLLINEVLYDPAADAAGDANGDGVRDPLDDEFVELYNDSMAIDISGFTLSDAAMVRHVFPTGTVLPSRGVMIVFGGGNPTGTFGGAVVQTASGGQLNLNNAGDVLTLRDNQGNVLGVFDINGLSGNPDEAYTRNPDISGGFQLHSSIPEAESRLFSPGVRLNGSNF